MKFDAKGLPVPDLAKSVDYDPKTLTYTFHLRDGVKWHDGAPFSARDVVYTYTALTSDKTLTSTITSNYQDISRISAPDEHTVVIRLARVNAAMLTSTPCPPTMLPWVPAASSSSPGTRPAA